MTVSRSRCVPRLVPNPVASESGNARFRHRDLSELQTSILGAERHLLAHRLAWTTFRRRPDRLLFVDEERRPIGEREWMRERLERLDAESRRRRGGDARHAR